MTRTVYIALGQFAEQDDRPLQILQQSGFTIQRNTLGRRLRREEMAPNLREADAVLAGVEPYDAEILQSLPRLRCISRCGIGTDSIDLKTAERQKVAVLTTPEEVVQPVAEMTVAMLFALARNFPLHADDFRNGRWKKHTGHLLSEWTLGLIGFGRIGQEVERCLRPFHPRVLVTDPAVKEDRIPPTAVHCDLDRLLGESDVVSLHAGRSPEDGPLLGRAELARMKPGSRLINTARGYLVEETALLENLKSGRLSGAALDVFGEEPYSGPLCGLPQVLLTPHVATLTRASRAAMELRSARNVIEFFSRGDR